MLKSMQKGNPTDVANELMNSNPEFANVVNLINQNGGNGKELFYQQARAKGMNDQQINEFLTEVQSILN